MRFFVIIAACIGIASALSYEAPGPGGRGSGDAAVRIIPTPLVYQDQVGGEGQPGGQPEFGGGYPGQPGAQTYARADAGAGVGPASGYQPGVQPGFGGGYPGQPGAQTYARADAGAGVGPASGYQPGVQPGFGDGYPGQPGAQTYARADARAGVGPASGYQPGVQAGATATANANAVVRYAKPEITKNYYYHVAPEETKTHADVNTLTITPRKHYKVIFIKAPSDSANADTTAKAASKTEEKTFVYVLVNNKAKATGNSDAKTDSFVSGKPEVYFVKYENKNAGATAIANARATAGSDGTFSSANANADAGSGFNGNTGGSGAGANANAAAGYDGDFGRTGSYANAGASAGAAAQNGGFGNGPAFNGGASAGATAGANSGRFF